MLLAEERKQSIEDNYSREIFTTSAPTEEVKCMYLVKIVLKFAADHQYFIEDIFFLYICTLFLSRYTLLYNFNAFSLSENKQFCISHGGRLKNQ